MKKKKNAGKILEEATEFQSAWNQCTGEMNGLRIAQGMIESRAIELFRLGKDEQAKDFRAYAAQLQLNIDRYSDRLIKFIQESEKKNPRIPIP